jgi:hypothetical protein
VADLEGEALRAGKEGETLRESKEEEEILVAARD